MAVNYSGQLGLLAQQYPPPLLPKPGRDNVRLQKLLKKSAKKKTAPQATQAPAPFRSSLSPVNEASPDLEHSDHSTPPKTPETPIYGVPQPQRFTVRPLYQHVPSPYPQLRGIAYGSTARFSPQMVVASANSFPQPGPSVSCFTPSQYPVRVSPLLGPATQALAPKTSVPTSSVPEITIPAFHMTLTLPPPVHGTATPSIVKPVTVIAPLIKPISPAPIPFVAAGIQTVFKPLTVLTPFAKPRSPRPMFKANESRRSPKPMFDVPQIRTYTANTSFYEMSKTPLYDSSGLASIGGTLPSSKTPTLEMNRDSTPTLEVKRGSTPVYEIKRGTTQTSEEKEGLTSVHEIKRGTTPTSEVKRDLTPVYEKEKGITSTSEANGLTPTSSPAPRRKTPTSEIRRGTTPTSEIRQGTTPTLEVKRNLTPTSEIKKASTPIYDSATSRTPSGRPKTPSYHVTRVKTPVFEISRTNPLLFAVSPIPTELQRSRTPTPVPTPTDVSSKPQTTINSDSSKSSETHKNNINLGAISVDTSKSADATVLKPEPHHQEAPVLQDQSTRPKTPTTPSGYQRAKSPTGDTAKSKSHEDQRPRTPSHDTQKPTAPDHGYQRPKTPTTPVYGYQRPKTPTYNGSKPPIAGYQRPKTPTYGTSPSGVSSAAVPRPKTPTYVAQKSKSSYRGLTPAEYVAHGGIQKYSPQFGLSRSKTPTQENTTSAIDVLLDSKTVKDEETVKESDKTNRPMPTPTAMVVPTIVVTQASHVSETTSVSLESSIIQSHASEVHESQTLSQGISSVRSPTSQKPMVKTSDKEVKMTVQELPKTKTSASEAQRPLLVTGNVADNKKPTLVKTNDVKVSMHTIEQVAVDKNKLTKSNVLQQRVSMKVTQFQEPAQSAAEAKADLPTPPSTDTAPVKPAIAAKTQVELSDFKVKPEKATPTHPEPSEKKEGDLPAAEALLKVIKKPKGMKSKLSGWSRLKKHMVVEQEEPEFPQLDSKKETTEVTVEAPGEAKKIEQKGIIASEKPGDANEEEGTAPPIAAKMWNAVLFQMFSSEEKIIQQIEANKKEEEKEKKEEPKEIPSFAHRLPVLLFSPRFDAKRLREAASRPLTKMSTVFEMGLIGRKEEEPKDFNRKARGFTVS